MIESVFDQALLEIQSEPGRVCKMNARHAAALRALELDDDATPRIMTARELAEYLQIHLVTLYRMARKHHSAALK
jgi:hypothetical protein